jgi:hypothetical protein
VKEVNASDTRGKSGNDVREGIDGRGLHSSTSQLKLSRF